ncbi:hypothetical protein ACFX1X_013200 [Malus domestica]
MVNESTFVKTAVNCGAESGSVKRWRSSMAWVNASSRSTVKELAFFGTVMSRWICSRNWRDSNSSPYKVDLSTVALVGSIELSGKLN